MLINDEIDYYLVLVGIMDQYTGCECVSIAGQIWSSTVFVGEKEAVECGQGVEDWPLVGFCAVFADFVDLDVG